MPINTRWVAQYDYLYGPRRTGFFHQNPIMAPKQSSVWRPEDVDPPVPQTLGSEIFRPDILDEIEKKIGEMSKELNELSLDIHGTPSL